MSYSCSSPPEPSGAGLIVPAGYTTGGGAITTGGAAVVVTGGAEFVIDTELVIEGGITGGFWMTSGGFGGLGDRNGIPKHHHR
jgi:hypothetical protein